LTTDLSSRTTNSLTVRARAYDNDSPAQTLTYTLSLNGQTRTATGTSGNYVTFSAVSGLSEYTTYSWTVTVKDSCNASISGSGSDRTYCSGRIYSCSNYSSSTCSRCFGTGYFCPLHPYGTGQEKRHYSSTTYYHSDCSTRVSVDYDYLVCLRTKQFKFRV
ncbi:MAG: hypothetical protein HFJ50_10325, partial [Clostridia bacterium]|nr:hypothetical protein [Clostridia bacterium]